MQDQRQWRAVAEGARDRHLPCQAIRRNATSFAAEVLRLKTEMAGYKVALEAKDAQIAEIESRMQTAYAVRDEAVALREKYLAVCMSVNALMHTFEIPNAPLVRNIPEDEACNWRCVMVRPMRTAVVTVALLGLGIASGATEAADKCLSRSEARALYRTSYLYWRGQGGKRCWTSSRRGGRAEPHRLPRQAVLVTHRAGTATTDPAGRPDAAASRRGRAALDPR